MRISSLNWDRMFEVVLARLCSLGLCFSPVGGLFCSHAVGSRGLVAAQSGQPVLSANLFLRVSLSWEAHFSPRVKKTSSGCCFFPRGHMPGGLDDLLLAKSVFVLFTPLASCRAHAPLHLPFF